MTQVAWPIYIGIMLATGGAVLAVTPIFLRLAVRLGLFDHPGGHKSHGNPVPYLGGLGIVLTFSLLVLGIALAGGAPDRLGELAVVLGLGVLLGTVGLVDDLRGLGPWIRLFVQVGAAVALWATGVHVELFGTAFDLALTTLWVVGVMNAFNLLDNMDGLSAGVAAIGALSFLVIAAVNGQFLVASLSAAIAGCAFGFLRHNFHPARIYMGDAGSLFLGFILSVIGIKLRFDAPTQITFFVPVLVLGVAIFDTTVVTVTRLLHGRNPLAGGRDHISHRLVFVGIPVPVAVSLIYAGGASFGWLALVMSRVDVATGFILMAFILTVALFLGILLGAVPVYETSRRRRLMFREVERVEERLDATPPPKDDVEDQLPSRTVSSSEL